MFGMCPLVSHTARSAMCSPRTQYSLQVQIDPGKCNGCGACEAACPTKPHKAIVILPV